MRMQAEAKGYQLTYTGKTAKRAKFAAGAERFLDVEKNTKLFHKIKGAPLFKRMPKSLFLRMETSGDSF